MAAKNQHRQSIIFLLVVLAVILLAIGGSLYYSGFRIGKIGISDSGKGDSIGSNRYPTLTDAQIICEQETREVFGGRIRNLLVDTHSSRLDQKARVFRVFIEADLYESESRQGSTTRHFINCFTRTDRVAIASFQFAKDGETMKDPGGSVFGF